MASYIQGYDQERFVTTISKNFICLICFNVLKDPVLCPRNQHCFCRGCITKHLENSRRCPTCADELTEESQTEPNRIVTDYLNELNIRVFTTTEDVKKSYNYNILISMKIRADLHQLYAETRTVVQF